MVLKVLSFLRELCHLEVHKDLLNLEFGVDESLSKFIGGMLNLVLNGFLSLAKVVFYKPLW